MDKATTARSQIEIWLAFLLYTAFVRIASDTNTSWRSVHGRPQASAFHDLLILCCLLSFLDLGFLSGPCLCPPPPCKIPDCFRRQHYREYSQASVNCLSALHLVGQNCGRHENPMLDTSLVRSSCAAAIECYLVLNAIAHHEVRCGGMVTLHDRAPTTHLMRHEGALERCGSTN